VAQRNSSPREPKAQCAFHNPDAGLSNRGHIRGNQQGKYFVHRTCEEDMNKRSGVLLAILRNRDSKATGKALHWQWKTSGLRGVNTLTSQCSKKTGKLKQRWKKGGEKRFNEAEIIRKVGSRQGDAVAPIQMVDKKQNRKKRSRLIVGKASVNGEKESAAVNSK